MNPSARLSDSLRKTVNKPTSRALNLGYIYLKNGELVEAENCARESINEDHTDKGYRLLGEVLLAQNKRLEALNAFEKSLELNPKQEFCLSRVCDLIEPDASSVEKLEFWALRTAKIGYLDISARFSRSAEAARQASFPNNPDLSKVVKNITQSEKKFLNQNSPQQSIQSPAARRSVSNSVSISTPAKLNSTLPSFASTSKLEESIDSVVDTVSQLVKEVRELTRLTLAQGSELKELRRELKSLRTQPIAPATAMATPPSFQSNWTSSNSTSNDQNEPVLGSQRVAPRNEPSTTPKASEVKPPAQVTPAKPTPLQQHQPKPPVSENSFKPDQSKPPVFGSFSTPHLAPSILGAPPSINTTFNSSPNPPPSFAFGGLLGKAPGQPAGVFTAPNLTSAPPATTTASATPPTFGLSWTSSNATSNDQSKPVFGFGLNASSGGFFGSTESKGDGGFKWGGNTSNTPWMNSTPKPIFGAQKTNENEDEPDSDPEEDKVDDSQFKLPAVSNLPSKVEIKTGEEDEEVIYSQRAKVYRFDLNTKEWKERGVGDLKILKHKEKNKYRILMRREQVHKIAVNFYITSEMEIKQTPNSDTSVRLTAMDASDEEPAFSSLAFKFKNKDILDIFLKKFEECRSSISDAVTPNTTPSKNEPSTTPKTSEEKPQVQVTSTKPPLLQQPQQAKPPVSENSFKPDQSKPPVFGSFSSSPLAPSILGASPSINSTFNSSPNPPPPAGSFTFGGLLGQAPGQQVGFNSPNSTSTPSTTPAPPSFGLNWTNSNATSNDQSKPVFGFGLNSSSTGGFFGSTDSKNDGGFKWGGNTSNPPSWMNAAPKPIFGAPKTNENEDEAGSDPEEDKVDDSQFKLPAVGNLPSKVEIKTGEEDEEVIYSQRAKVFRFDTKTKEWKERGVGDLKILKHRERNKYRILMRREQVHKIAVNFYITSEMEIKPLKNSETSVQWTALDYSDETPAFSMLAAKFKNKELVDVFVKKVEELKSTLDQSFSGETGASGETGGEVEVVFEKKPADDLVEKARKLQLPDSFYNHLDAKPCEGCRGCIDENEKLTP